MALPSSKSCGESSAKQLIQSGQPLAIGNGIAERDQATEADTAEKDRAIAEFADQEIKRGDLVALIDE
jgi:hypothetical protein